MFRYKVEDKSGKVLGIKNKIWEAQTLYRKHYKEGAKIVVLESGPNANEDFNSLTSNNGKQEPKGPQGSFPQSSFGYEPNEEIPF